MSNMPVRDVFPELPLDIWTEEFFRANELLNLYTDYQVGTVLDRLGVGPEEPLTTDPACLLRYGVAPARRESAAWLLAKAYHSSSLARKSEGGAEAAPPRAESPCGGFTLLRLEA